MIEAIVERCAGLDVHQETVVACILTGPLDHAPRSQVRTFGTMVHELLELGEWLSENGCTQVTMESTGVFWKPVWNVLEAFEFELLLANAYHIKNLPGRKTDVNDAQWIAKLLRCGLIEGSFVPSIEVRELRDLNRYRKKLVHEATAEKNRIHKALQDANIKLTTHMSDVFGVSGRKLIQMIVDGEVITMDFLESHMKGALKHKSNKLLQSLNGRLRQHHRDLIRMSWEHLLYLEKVINKMEKDILQRISDKQETIQLLTTIPGISEQAAATIAGEIGFDPTQFRSEHCLAAWAGLSPGNHESAGHKKRKHVRPGNLMIKSILCECAWAASSTRKTRLAARYWNWVKRMGKKKALVALAHTIIRIIYNVLKHRKPYQELGPDYLECRKENYLKKKENDMIRFLEAAGYSVSKAQ